MYLARPLLNIASAPFDGPNKLVDTNISFLPMFLWESRNGQVTAVPISGLESAPGIE